MERKSFFERFIELKGELLVKKDEFSDFGQFSYRTKEQIYNALRPLEQKYGIYVSTTHDIRVIEGRLFVVAVAEARDVYDSGEIKLSRTSLAELQKLQGTKMNESQLSGSAESYAAKRALESMFGLGDGVDADSPQAVIKTFGSNVTEKPTLKTVPFGKVEEPEVKTFGKVVEEQSEVEPEETVTLYSLKQATLQAKTKEDIKSLIDSLNSLGGDDQTLLVIETRAKSLGLTKNQLTKNWE